MAAWSNTGGLPVWKHLQPVPAETKPIEQTPDALEHAQALIAPSFDAALYASEYPDLLDAPGALLRHFCQHGWREGRNPNRGFDTTSYLLAHPDVDAHGINPYYHYLLAGRAEGRTTTRAFLPSEISKRVFGRPVRDWVSLLRPRLDRAFYLAALGFDPGDSFDPVAHFTFRGWLEELDPNPRFHVRAALAANPTLRHTRLNPLLLALLLEQRLEPVRGGSDAAKRTTRLAAEALASKAPTALLPKPGITAGFADPVQRMVGQHLDPAFYLLAYPDVRSHGVDPVKHYCEVGWSEGRNPQPAFDTTYYLAANPDVAAQPINPFWHYLVIGRAEGRLPRQPGFYRKQVIEQARPPHADRPPLHRPEITAVLSRAELDAMLTPILDASAGLALSIGHDRYVTVPGGLQLFLATEQAAFQRQGVAYLNLSPFHHQLRLADGGHAGQMLNLLLDGALLGIASILDLAAVLARLPPRPGQRRLFLVHCLLGHHPAALQALHQASGSTENIFWLHDYSSVCAGYALLRNDLDFCGAPPPDSMACRVCVYGEHRATHLAAVRDLLDAIPFHVVAPSAAALRTWKAAGLTCRSSAVHAHCRLVPDGLPQPRDLSGPVRVAFLGYPKPHKGWPIWQDLIASCCQAADYRWFHLGTITPDALQDCVEHHPVTTTPQRPDAMIAALARLEIDLVAILSPWPETFSYATFEALAAGADVVCLASSGNVADTVALHRRGAVAPDAESLIAFFTSGKAASYARQARRAGIQRGRLLHEGTTATLANGLAP